MQQLELFDYRRDYLYESNNQIAHYYDILKETEDTISYAEHIDPNKGYAIACMEYEETMRIFKFIVVNLLPRKLPRNKETLGTRKQH